MKEIRTSIYVLLISLCMNVFADEDAFEICFDHPPEKKEICPLVEVKAGYFYFSDDTMREIYNRGGLDVQLSGSYPFGKWARWLQIYGSVEYLTRNGRALGDGSKTSIWEVPLSLGLKPVLAFNRYIHYYATIGPRYVFVHQHNDSEFVDRIINDNGLGCFVNTGFNFFPTHNFLIDVFFEYSYVRWHFYPTKPNVYGSTIQIGGFTFGGGLGYAF